MEDMILLISGKQGSGKDTLASKLDKIFWTTHAYCTFRFAEDIYAIHDFARERLRGNGIIVQGDKDGDLLQYLGTEWGRKRYGDNVWVKTTLSRISHWGDAQEQIDKTKQTFAVITDCRFRNEFDAVPMAYRIRLECPEEVRRERRGKTWRENTTHQSEIDLDEYVAKGKFDLVVDTHLNDADKVAEIVVNLLKKPLARHQQGE